MAIDLTKVLKEQQIKKLGDETVKVITEACNAELSAKISEMETTNAEKFDKFVSSLVKQFDSRVESAINESVKNNLIGTANEKMFNVLQNVANIMEAAGIPVTENTKVLQMKLKEADTKLAEDFKVRETLKKELDNAEKEKYIMNRLQGLRPEIVAHALAHFKDRDILDVQDEIGQFIEGDFASIIPDTDSDKFTKTEELNLDDVRDALAEIDQGVADNKAMNEIKTKSKFESLNKNLSMKKIIGFNEDITTEALNESINPKSDLEDDALEAMNKIQDFNNLGYKYR